MQSQLAQMIIFIFLCKMAG